MSPSINILFQKANNQIADNELEHALLTYKKICKQQKNNVQVLVNMGNIAGKLGKFKEAEIAFRSACKLQDMKGSASTPLAHVLEAQGKFSDAINILKKYHKNNTNDYEVLLNIGVLYGKSNDYKNSILYIQDYIKYNKKNSFALHCLASCYESENNFSSAKELYEKSLALSPNSAQIHNNYASILQKSGDWDGALSHYLKALDLNPNYSIAHHNIATLYLLQGKIKKSREHYSVAININNNYVEAIVGLGKTHALDNLYDDAINTYRHAIQINNRYAEAYSNMALSYMARNDYDTAMDAYKTALNIEPDNIEIQCNIILLLERKGDFEQAIENITPLVESDPGNIYIAKAFGELSRKLKKQSYAIQNINIATKNKAIGAIAKSELYFLAGKLSDDIGNYDDAFNYYKLANDLQPYNFDREQANRSFNLITNLYTRDEIEKLKNTTDNNHNPIFIIGMPRSGTTLVESIISSHPDVYGAGELHYMNEIAADIVKNYQTDTKEQQLSEILRSDNVIAHAKSYLHLSAKLSSGVNFVTDKMPHNFQHVGLIKALFPEAKIIHCERNPIDICLSIYFNNFNTAHTYATDLDELAEYYLTFYKKIMQHWDDNFKDAYLSINYEDIVANQEEVSRKIIDYCGLDWSDKCLQFYKSKRNISTFSYDQVRKPIYNKSVNRWKNYESHIESIINKLQIHT